MQHILYLASQSTLRQQLLKEAGISFLILSQNADERSISWEKPLKELLLAIVDLKSKAVQMPHGDSIDQRAFVLTVDSMPQAADGSILSKPADHAQALSMLEKINGKGIAATAYCVERKRWDGSVWVTEQRKMRCVTTEVSVNLPPEWREKYIEHVPWYLVVAGAMDVMEFGAQFLSSVKGSYGAVLSLPVFEIRKDLEELGFYE